MSTCLDIITSAMRTLGVLAIGREPKAAEAEEGMFRLQAIVDGMFGCGVGGTLLDLEIATSQTLVADTRALVFAVSPITLAFPESPFNGARIQIKDMSGNFALYPVTLDGNNRTVADAVLNTNGADVTYIYIADTANWARVSPLGLSDVMPITDDEFFVLDLAKRLAPLFGAQFQDDAGLIRSANRIRARFASQVVIPCDDAVRFLSRQSYTSFLDQPPA